VIGKVFWAGALARMSERDPRDVELALHELARKELVRPARGSSMQGEREYGFWHLLVRDVCYAQIPRASRAARHAPQLRGSSARPGNASTTSATCSPITTPNHWSSPVLPAKSRTSRSWRQSRADISPWPGIGRCRSTWPAPKPAFARAIELPLGTTLIGRPCWNVWAYATHLLGRQAGARAALEEALALHRDAGDTVAAARTLTALSRC